MNNEFYVRNNSLIPLYEWEEKIKSIHAKVISLGEVEDKELAKKTIAEKVSNAIKRRIPNMNQSFGVLLSGGVDSALIALLLKSSGREFTCYTLGFRDGDSKEPDDVLKSKIVAEKLGLKLRTRILNLEEAEQLIKKTVLILGEELNNVVNVGVGGVVLGCIEMAKKDGITCLFSGLGSEEIFAGYQRHRLAGDKQAECWNGLLGMYERDLLRDYAVARATRTSLLTPFLDEELILHAMRVPARFKMNEEHSKLILREAAELLGLPSEFAWREKKAAQYGSRLDKAIAKLAHKNKFRHKKDYLKSINS